MSVKRPITKEILKKTILKSLYEDPDSVGWDVICIISLRIPRFLEIDGLSREEEELSHEAILELEKTGFIKPDLDQHSNNFKVLTKRGKKYAEQPFENMNIPSVDINDVITRTDLLKRVQEDYINGKYSDTITKTFELIKKNIKNKTGSSSNDWETIISSAFNPNNGLLEHENAQKKSEKENLYLMINGAIKWFGDSHFNLDNDPKKVIKIIAFGELILDIIDESTLK